MRKIGFLLISLFLIIGCKSSAKQAPPATISGTVTVNERELEKGTIQFIKIGEVPVIVEITNGKFSTSLQPGKYRIEITAFRKMKNPPPKPKIEGPGTPSDEEQYLPAEYNTESKYEEEFKSGESRELKYTLKSTKN